MSAPVNILALDPGTSGGWCSYERHDGIPFTASWRWGSLGGNDSNVRESLGSRQWDLVVIEEIRAAHRMSSGIAKLLIEYGFLRGIFRGSAHRLEILPPQVWQHFFNITGKGAERKKNLLDKAKKLVADGAIQGPRITYKNCDAILLCEYARFKLT